MIRKIVEKKVIKENNVDKSLLETLHKFDFITILDSVYEDFAGNDSDITRKILPVLKSAFDKVKKIIEEEK